MKSLMPALSVCSSHKDHIIITNFSNHEHTHFALPRMPSLLNMPYTIFSGLELNFAFDIQLRISSKRLISCCCCIDDVVSIVCIMLAHGYNVLTIHLVVPVVPGCVALHAPSL